MEITVRQLTPADLDAYIQLIRVMEEVFEWEDFVLPGLPHLQKTLAQPATMVFVAFRDGRVVGGLTAYRLDLHSSERPSAYLYDLAVASDLQRQGIGRRLVTALLDHCRAEGYQDVFVQADVEDTHAIDFYRATQASSALQAVHFTYDIAGGPPR